MGTPIITVNACARSIYLRNNYLHTWSEKSNWSIHFTLVQSCLWRQATRLTPPASIQPEPSSSRDNRGFVDSFFYRAPTLLQISLLSHEWQASTPKPNSNKYLLSHLSFHRVLHYIFAVGIEPKVPPTDRGHEPFRVGQLIFTTQKCVNKLHTGSSA